MSKIKVRLIKHGVVNVKLKPENGVRVKDDTTYLYDPTLVADFVDLAEDWAIKTDGQVEEEGVAIDYSSKAWAIGGTGTETNNSKYYAEQAAISETNASNSATSAGNSATTATTQAGIATTKAGLAAASEANALSYSQSAASSANDSSNSAAAAYSSEINAASSASTALTQAGIATTKAGEAAASAAQAANSAIWAEGTDVQVAAIGGEKSSKGWAARAKELVDSIGSVLHYKGSVATIGDLPTSGQELGDMYNVTADGSNWVWSGTDWDEISGIVDLSAYRTSADQDVIDAGKVPTTRTVNGKALSSDITLTNADIGSQPAGNYVTTDTAQTITQDKAFSGTLTVADNIGLASGTILSNKKILQKTSSGVEVGNSTEDLLLVGKSATVRPTYNGNDLALKSDVPTSSDYWTIGTSGVNDTQTSYSRKLIKYSATYSASGDDQQNGFRVLGDESASTGSSSFTGYWMGRMMVGTNKRTFLLGVTKNTNTNSYMCGLGAHSWTDAEAQTGAAWEDIYIQPDGNKAVYFGGKQWQVNSGWMKVQNDGNSTAAYRTFINVGTNTSPTWRTVLPNQATGTNSVLIRPNTSSTFSYTYATSINGTITANYGTSLGYNASAGSYGVSIGYDSAASGSYSIQLGRGTNSTANTMSVGLSNSLNVQLLDASGEIPDARIKTTIARVTQIPTDTSDLTNGAGYITSASLSTLTDTEITTPSSGEILKYDGSKWINSASGASVTDVEVNGTSVVSGGVASVTVPTQASDIGALPDTTTASDIGGANKDLSNLTATGKNIGNWSSNVTNCITYIPQDIKLELSEGTLTLKAGSKVYVPNGFEQDGTTPKFDELILDEDVVAGYSNSASNLFAFININTNGIAFTLEGDVTSGTSQPSVTNNRRTWYDVNNNIIKSYAPNSSDFVQVCFPIAIVTCAGSNVFSKIQQVFNGIGYIGSTVFCLPGVKGLIPDGRNTDGSLKSVEYEVQNVAINTNTSGVNGSRDYGVKNDGTTVRSLYNVADDGYLHQADNYSSVVSGFIFCSAVSSSGVIKQFYPGKVFNSVDETGSSYKIDSVVVPTNQSIASSVSLNASGATSYNLTTLPDDGHNYMCLIFATAQTGTTAGNNVLVQVTTSLMSTWCPICRAITRTASYNNCCGATWIPVGSDRVLQLNRSTSWNGTATVSMIAYRRIGNNT